MTKILSGNSTVINKGAISEVNQGRTSYLSIASLIRLDEKAILVDYTEY
jgi:hypothetical protein